MKKVGFVGWRGMVGSVLMNRMEEEGDFAGIDPVFFSTSQAGQKAPSFGGKDAGVLLDASNLEALKSMDIIVTCQGGAYTKDIYPKLQAAGWSGYWVDAASTLRMEDNAIIILFAACNCSFESPIGTIRCSCLELKRTHEGNRED